MGFGFAGYGRGTQGQIGNWKTPCDLSLRIRGLRFLVIESSESMKAIDTLFCCRWESFSMEIAGLSDVRRRKGTYGRYDFFALPSLPFELRGDWTGCAPPSLWSAVSVKILSKS